MNRRDLLKKIGLGTAAVVVAPIVPLSSTLPYTSYWDDEFGYPVTRTTTPDRPGCCIWKVSTTTTTTT